MLADINQLTSPMLASRDKAKLNWWRKGLHGFINLHEVNDLSQLIDEISHLKPKMLLIDYEILGTDMVSEICSLKKLHLGIRIVVLTNSYSKEEEWSLLKAGISGCCQWDVEPSTQKTLIQAIHQGELWIRRSLTCKLLEQLKLSSKDFLQNEAAQKRLDSSGRQVEVATKYWASSAMPCTSKQTASNGR